jgi:predicted ribosome quality control (RQC) complex YloA/Tae2 family protein
MKHEVIYLKNINRDITYLIGTNAQDNFDVIDASDPDDIWLHVKDLPSCHVVAKIPDDMSGNKELLSIVKRGALLCKQHSKYSSIQNLEIIYTRIKNVQKTAVPGSVQTLLTKSVKV